MIALDSKTTRGSAEGGNRAITCSLPLIMLMAPPRPVPGEEMVPRDRLRVPNVDDLVTYTVDEGPGVCPEPIAGVITSQHDGVSAFPEGCVLAAVSVMASAVD